MEKEQEIQKAKDFTEGKDTTRKVAVIFFTIKEIEGILNLKDPKMCIVGKDAFSNDNKILLKHAATEMAASLSALADSLKEPTV